MFSSGVGGPGSAVSGASMDPVTQPTLSEDSTSHKKKKKKKKSKKHKKHKHEKHEKSEKSQPEFGETPGLVEFASSEQSTASSPAVHRPPSSPEFEVMWIQCSLYIAYTEMLKTSYCVQSDIFVQLCIESMDVSLTDIPQYNYLLLPQSTQQNSDRN